MLLEQAADTRSVFQYSEWREGSDTRQQAREM